MNYFVYIIKCCGNTLYTGYTNDLVKRFKKHCEGKGAKYTKSRSPLHLVYFEEFKTKSEAMKREYQIKQLTRKEKMKLIYGSNTHDPKGSGLVRP
jgi:putative endonuclease